MKPLLALLLSPLLACATDAGQPTRTPVLVELFTSEGCSSCPPADALLMTLDASQPLPGANVIALEEHVDYWDRLGWRDPFSSAVLTARQRRYAGALDLDSAYTPEMVIDGRKEFVGNDSRRAANEIERAAQSPKAPLHLSWLERSAASAVLSVETGAVQSDAQVVLAVTERKLASDVSRGENAGRNLRHAAIVRQLTVIGKTKAGKPFSGRTEVRLSGDWKPSNVSAVVFVQNPAGGQVLAAAQLPFAN